MVMSISGQCPDWREFESLVARIEADAGPHGMTVTSPDRIIPTAFNIDRYGPIFAFRLM